MNIDIDIDIEQGGGETMTLAHVQEILKKNSANAMPVLISLLKTHTMAITATAHPSFMAKCTSRIRFNNTSDVSPTSRIQ